MSLLGLAFLLLLAGLEVEYELRGRLLRHNASGYAISFGWESEFAFPTHIVYGRDRGQ
jgi:hypothetical protein